MLQSMVFCTSIPLQSYAAFSLREEGYGKDSMFDNLPAFGICGEPGPTKAIGPIWMAKE